MWDQFVHTCVGGFPPTRLLGYASTWGALFVAAMLLQPLRGAQLEDLAASAPAGNGDLNFSAPANWAENSATAHDDATGVPLAPAMDCGRRRYFFADVLLWNVREGLDENWAQIITSTDFPTANTGTAALVGAPFPWRAGLRVGMGVQPSDGFEMTAYYTYFRTTAVKQASGDVYSGFMGNFYVDNADGVDFGPYYRSANIQWAFRFDTIDFEIARNCTIGTNLELKPFVGLKAGIINQSIKTNWFDPINTSKHTYTFTSASEYQDPHFWGIGPSLGVTMTMPLRTGDTSSLKLFGTPSGAIMLGHWTCSEQYVNNEQTTVTIDTSPITGVATMLRGVVGLQWQRCLSRVTSTVQVGYEAQLWLNQMQLYSYNMGRLNNVTSLEGGFAEWCLGF
jgi:hypothetical protein